MVTIGYLWLLKCKVKLIQTKKYNEKFCFSLELAIWQRLSNHMWLVAAISGWGRNTDPLQNPRKLYWMVLSPQSYGP